MAVMLLHRLARRGLARQGARLRAPLLSRRFCTSEPQRPPPVDEKRTLLGVPGDSELIGTWMNDPELVDQVGWGRQQIGFMRRMEMYTMLHLMPGFDLPEFLDGTRFAYGAVTRLMYARDWEALEPLVSPACLDAMVATMHDIADGGRRIVEADADDAIQIESATLHRVLLLDDPTFETGMPRKVHIDVRFMSTERWIMHDYHENEPVKPFDGSPFEQNTVMRWEGEVVPPGSSAEARNWKLYGLV